MMLACLELETNAILIRIYRMVVLKKKTKKHC